MSTIQIVETKRATYDNLGRYFYATMECGKHRATFAVAPSYVQVIVENASHRAFRQMGKRFASIAEAAAAYKTAEIRDMVQLAGRLAAEGAL